MQPNPSQWSTPTLGQRIEPGTVAAPVVTDVLTVRVSAPSGCHVTPRLLTVRARVSQATEPTQSAPGGLPLTEATDAWIVRWGVGSATFRAELDSIASGASFGIWCDWMTLHYKCTGAGALLAQAAAIDAGGANEAHRPGRRTVAGKLGPAPATLDVAIPEGASRVQVLNAIQLPTAPLVAAVDTKGAVQGSFLARPFEWLLLPVGSATLRFSNNPAGVDVTLTCVFEIIL